MTKLHFPVMLNESIDFIGINPIGSYADLTFGEGGHSLEMLKRGAQSVLAFDRDPSVIENWKGKEPTGLKLVHSRFSHLPQWVKPNSLDGVLLDLGVSTKQILSPDFSFQGNVPLDMRMDPSEGQSLLEYLSSVDEETLAQALWENAELKGSRSLARRIFQAVQNGSLKTTRDLAGFMGPRRGPTHPATTLFMALRMAVNEELLEIREVIPAAIEALKTGGRLAIISFHSIEDRLVKRLFLRAAGRCICEKRFCECPRKENVKILTPKPVLPSTEELEKNPRSRSAKLRCIEKMPIQA